MARNKGKIGKDYWVECGKCEFFIHTATNTYDETLDYLKTHGWKRNNIHGWICPSCVDASHRKR